MTAFEVNFDGIVGPTHNYSGLSYGNVASMNHQQWASNPKKAAHQGLDKMRALMQLGIKQAVFPPQERPFIPFLRALGFTGTDAAILEHVWKDEKKLLTTCSSAASMWAANTATVSPSADSLDGKIHLTPANMATTLHRTFETHTNSMILRRIFADPDHFVHHWALPPHSDFADEGAANHTRFCANYDQPGIQLFVYGRSTSLKTAIPMKFPARQTLEASMAIARLHYLNLEKVIFAQQNPEAIDLGVFHNDVISLGNQHLFFYHEKAFLNTPEITNALTQKMEEYCGKELYLLPVSQNQISIEEAVRTYLFNSQLITLPDQQMVLIAPIECQQSKSVQAYLQEWIDTPQHPVKKIIYQDVRESMQNGGGPACLRLRVVTTPKEFDAINPAVVLTENLYKTLSQWIDKHYRDKILPEDLADPYLLVESRFALDELTRILNLGSIYPFQMMRNP